MMRMIDINDSPVERIDTGDRAEVVFDRWFEIPVVRIQNEVWVEGPRYLAFTGAESVREIDDLIEALQELRKAVSK